MRDVLEALAAGECSVAEAEAALAGYATVAAGRFDAARRERTGIPEAVLASGKTPAEVASLAAVAVETTGHALVTRTDADDRAVVRERIDAEHRDATLTVDDRARTVVHADGYDPPSIDATVDVPVIGLSVSVGHGAGGDGEAALLGMLQSCSPLTVVNIDNGFAAGAQAGLVANALDAARSGTDQDDSD